MVGLHLLGVSPLLTPRGNLKSLADARDEFTGRPIEGAIEGAEGLLHVGRRKIPDKALAGPAVVTAPLSHDVPSLRRDIGARPHRERQTESPGFRGAARRGRGAAPCRLTLCSGTAPDRRAAWHHVNPHLIPGELRQRLIGMSLNQKNRKRRRHRPRPRPMATRGVATLKRKDMVPCCRVPGRARIVEGRGAAELRSVAYLLDGTKEVRRVDGSP